jgi:putative ABC transport system permease protein
MNCRPNSQIKPEFIIAPFEQMKNDKEQWGISITDVSLLKPGTDVEALQQKFYDNIFLQSKKMRKVQV